MRIEYLFVTKLCLLQYISCDVSNGENQPIVLKNNEDSLVQTQIKNTFANKNSTNGNLETEKFEKTEIMHETHEESRKHQGDKNKNEKGFMEKVLPMMVTPFLVSSSMIPMMLVSMFMMLVKSAFMGKLGIGLMLFSMLRRNNNQGGVYSHNINLNRHEDSVAMDHYGYHGDEEYGAYVNRKRRK